MNGVLRYALARLAVRRGRVLLAAGGVAAAAAMLGAAVTVGYSLTTGFDRAAERADLADAIARFDPLPVGRVAERARALPNVAAVSFRLELGGVHVRAGDEFNGHGKLQGVRAGERRGYAIVAGRDLSGVPGEIVVERGLAREWGLGPGDALDVWWTGERVRIVGVAVTPDNVAFPLANGPRLYAPYAFVRGLDADHTAPGEVNLALLWTNDRSRLDITLAQARAASFGVPDLQFVTREGIRRLINQAAGIVVALLVAFSLVALAAAGIMLAASSSAEVQRRLTAIGVLRALGASPRAVAAGYAAEAALVAAPAAALGLVLGTLLVFGPTGRLLEALNELSPGWALAAPLAACFAGTVGIVAGAAAWPAWRAASRSPVETLRGADLRRPPRRARLPGGAAGLGMRLALARPVRTSATVAVLAASASVVLLMLSLASLLQRLESDPETVGKRYRISVPGGAEEAKRIARLPGVAGATSRYEVPAADSFSLGESFELVAFGADHTDYEAPPLAEGRRVAGDHEVEVGLGLSQALNLSLGSTLAAQLASGDEVRFRVVGIVRALENEGRIAYVRPPPLLRAEPSLAATAGVAVLVDTGSSKAAVTDELREAGYAPQSVEGVTIANGGFLDVLAALLRSVAVVDGLVCLYALAQMLALTAQERRGAVALVRALGGAQRQVAAVLAGSALVVALLAAVAGIALQRLVVAPAASGLASSYVSLSLDAGLAQAVLVTIGLVVLAVAASAWVARAAVREPIVAGLRED